MGWQMGKKEMAWEIASATSRIDMDKPHVPEPSVGLRIGLPGPPVDVRL